jgi:hypothetical protein
MPGRRDLSVQYWKRKSPVKGLRQGLVDVRSMPVTALRHADEQHFMHAQVVQYHLTQLTRPL